MFEVFVADIIKDWLGTLYDENVYSIPLLVILIGLFLNFTVTTTIFILITRGETEMEIFVSLVSVILTSILIVIISYIVIENSYYYIFSNYNFIQKIALIPQYIVFFSIYVLPSPILIWEISSVIFTVIITIAIKLSIEENYRGKKKIKPTYGNVL